MRDLRSILLQGKASEQCESFRCDLNSRRQSIITGAKKLKTFYQINVRLSYQYLVALHFT